MKRVVLPASALILVVTACGAGAKPAPRVAEVGAQLPRVRMIAAQREVAATDYATWSFSTPTRVLNVTAVALPQPTVIRVDAQVVWIYPRSPRLQGLLDVRVVKTYP